MSENNRLTPKIRFKGFTDDWEQRKLKDVSKFKQGIQVDLDKQYTVSNNNLVRFIRIVDYTQETDDLRYIDKSLTSETIKSDDIVLVRYGATAGFVGHGISGVLANNMFTVNPLEMIKKDYLYTYLKQEKIYNKLNNTNGSSAMPALNFGIVGDLDITYPKPREQENLSTLFSNIDNLITLHQRKYDKLIKIKSSLLEKMFPKNSSKIPEVRFKGFTDDWEQRKFGSCVTIQRGGSPRPIEAYLTTDDKKGVNWVKIGDVKPGERYIYKTAEKIIPEGVKHSREVYKGDLILSNSMSFGRPYIMGTNGCIHDGWLLIRDDKYLFNKEYLLQLLSSNYMLNQYKQLASGGVVNNLNSELVQNTMILIPNKSEQNELGEVFKCIDNLITLHQRKLDKLQNIKKSLLDKMFI